MTLLLQIFNRVEALLWCGVAVLLLWRLHPKNPRQRRAKGMAVAGFLLFGASDWLEAAAVGRVPLWLYAMKIACGALLLASRFTWIGWRHWHWRHRDFLFGVFCLLVVLAAIWFQYGRV